MCNSVAHIIFCWVSYEYAIQRWQQLTNSCLFGGLCLKVPLLAMMEEYNMLRNEKEKEKQRQRVSIISASSQQRAWSSARNFKQIHSPCENFSIYLLINKWALYPQEKKKVQSQVVVGQENLFGPRPSTSSRRLSNMSPNGGFSNATPLNRRISLGIQQLGSNSINSVTQGISFIKEGKKAHRQKRFAQTGLASHLIEDTASVVSTYSGPFSPWFSGNTYKAWLWWKFREYKEHSIL